MVLEPSWHEIGYYDLPAMIDYVLAKTGKPDLFYAGHSQGTTSFYMMAPLRPEYDDKIRVMLNLAPVAYMDHMISLFVDQIESFGLPPVKPKPSPAGKFKIQEGHYGVPDPMVYGLAATKEKLVHSHPLEESEKNYAAHELRMSMRMMQGLQGPLKLAMELRAAWATCPSCPAPTSCTTP